MNLNQVVLRNIFNKIYINGQRKSQVLNLSSITNSMQSQLELKLQNQFKPTLLNIINESNKHNVPKGSESHFKVLIVSNEFEGKSLIERHRMVNKALADELKTSVHALSIQAVTPTQWSANSNVESTPNCQGGHK